MPLQYGVNALVVAGSSDERHRRGVVASGPGARPPQSLPSLRYPSA